MKNFLISILALFVLGEIQSQNFFFNHLDLQNGLSHSTVQSIYQDEYGQMWFATRNGLNKYDGNNIQKVDIEIEGYDSFFFNDITTLTGDRKGNIFVQSMQKVIRFDTRNYKFEMLNRQETQNIQAIHYNDGKLWIATDYKLSYIIDGESQVRDYITLENKGEILKIKQSSDGTLYLGTHIGLIKIDSNKKQSELLDNVNVTCIYEDSKKQIWIGTLQDGLFVYNQSTGIENFKTSSPIERGPSNHLFASIFTFVKLEKMKLAQSLNHFAIKTKIYMASLRAAFIELNKIKKQIATA